MPLNKTLAEQNRSRRRAAEARRMQEKQLAEMPPFDWDSAIVRLKRMLDGLA